MSFERGARPEEVVGTKYLVTNSTDESYENGEIVTLTNNDGTAYPFFIVDKKVKVIGWHELSRIDEASEVDKSSDMVNHPSHYNSGKIEVIEMVTEIAKPYRGDVAVCIGNVVKYVARAPFKGTCMQDLRKAEWYLKRAIEQLEEPES